MRDTLFGSRAERLGDSLILLKALYNLPGSSLQELQYVAEVCKTHQITSKDLSKICELLVGHSSVQLEELTNLLKEVHIS